MTISRRNALFTLSSASLLLINAELVRDLIDFALNRATTHASQIVLIPFISGTLIYRNRGSIFQTVRFSALSGAALAAMGVGLFVAGKTWGANLPEVDYLALMTSSLVTIWLGGFLFFYGSAAFRAALFPLLFLAFCIPIPSRLLDSAIAVLQRGSADVTFFLLRVSGMPVYREQFVLTLPGLAIEVAPQCSGIRSAISLLILTLLAGHLMLRSMWSWAVLLIAAVPILIFKNALRISMLSLIAVHYDHRILTSRLHQEGGIPFFVVGLLLLYPVLGILMKSERKIGVRSVPQEAEL